MDESLLGKVGDCTLTINSPIFVEMSEAELVALMQADGCTDERIEKSLLKFEDNQATARAILGTAEAKDATWDAWTAETLSRCDDYAREARLECEQHFEAKRDIALVALLALPPEQRAEWRVHEQRLERIAEWAQNTSISREAVPFNCANARKGQADIREALEFIQARGNADLMGKEAQLLILVRAHDALVESCIALGE